MRTWVRLGWGIGSASCHSCFLILFKMEEDHLYALRWKELEMHSLALQNTLHKRTWSDEKNLLQQELRSLKQNIFLFYVKLRWLLKHWRQGKQMEEGGEDFTEVGPPTRAARLNLHLLYSGHPHITVSPIVSSRFYLSFAINPSHGNCVLSRHARKRASAVLGCGSKSSKVFHSPLEWVCSHPLGCGWI